MSAPLDFSAMADMAWILSLMCMNMCSLRAWKQLSDAAPVPMLWGPDGQSAIFVGRDLAVLFTPIAALIGGLLLAAGERLAGDHVSPGLIALRFAAPVLLVFAHRYHLQAAVDESRATAEQQ